MCTEKLKVLAFSLMCQALYPSIIKMQYVVGIHGLKITCKVEIE